MKITKYKTKLLNILFCNAKKFPLAPFAKLFIPTGTLLDVIFLD